MPSCEQSRGRRRCCGYLDWVRMVTPGPHISALTHQSDRPPDPVREPAGRVARTASAQDLTDRDIVNIDRLGVFFRELSIQRKIENQPGIDRPIGCR